MKIFVLDDAKMCSGKNGKGCILCCYFVVSLVEFRKLFLGIFWNIESLGGSMA